MSRPALLFLNFLLTFHCYGQNPEPAPRLAPIIDTLFRQCTGHDSPGYAVAVVKGRHILFQRCYGLSNLDYNIPITTSSAFDIASVSKQFTAACIALLIMDRKLDLDMPAATFIPELGKYKDTIRISHLLYNTSGIIDYYQLPRDGGRSWVTFNYFTNDECIRTSLKPVTLAFTPGTKWDYCNTNFMLLARIVGKISGQSFREFARQRLFLPLGMTHTIINDDATETISNRVTPYNPRTREIVDAYRKEGFAINYTPGWIQHPRNSPHYGGSGVNTTLSDLITWEKNFFSKRFGGEQFYQLMHRTQPFQNGKDNQAFGLYRGIYRDRIYWAWDGGDFGVSAQIIRFPGQQMAIIVLSNIGTGNAAQKALQIADILIGHHQM